MQIHLFDGYGSEDWDSWQDGLVFLWEYSFLEYIDVGGDCDDDIIEGVIDRNPSVVYHSMRTYYDDGVDAGAVGNTLVLSNDSLYILVGLFFGPILYLGSSNDVVVGGSFLDVGGIIERVLEGKLLYASIGCNESGHCYYVNRECCDL